MKAAALRIAILLAVLLGGAYLMRHALLNALLFLPIRELEDTPAAGGLSHEDLTIATADGERLHAWWVRAPRGPSLGHILFLHGNAGNISHRILDARLLVSEGFDVLLVDYRGYGRSTGRASEEGSYEDARAARRVLAARSGVDAARLYYMGESLGGAVALALALENPPAGLVLRSAFTDVRAMARLHYPFIPRFIVPDAYPSLRRVRSLRCPLLVLHGERDNIVPLEHGRALFEAAPVPKRLEVLPEAGHNDLLLVAGLRQARAIADWVREIGSAPGATDPTE